MLRRPIRCCRRTPKFIVWALKDPNGANLDRAQVAKVWLGKDGKYAEKIFNVALSNGRKADASGTVWQDPEFDASVPAVYYLRAIEIPTPRWSTILAVKRGLPLPPEVQPTLQERAGSSPIWYTPPKSH